MRAELELGSPTKVSLEAMFARNLVEGDLSLLQVNQGTKPPLIKNLRETHHQLARLLAQGLRAVEVSAITGYSQSRISILQNDPAFKELLSHYKQEVSEAFADVVGQLKTMSLDALGLLRERMEDSPDSFSNPELLSILNSMLDRTGHGVQSKVKSENTSIHLDGQTLIQIKSMIAEAQNGTVTIGNPRERIASEKAEQKDSLPNLSLEIEFRPEHQEPQTPGLESAGEGV